VRRRSSSLVLALTLLFVACASAGTPPQETAHAPEPELVPESTESPQPAAEPAQKHERILPEQGDFVAVPRTRYTPIWEKPGQGGAPDFSFDTQNPMGQLAPLLIDGATRRDGVEWLEVLLPLRPNGTSAWVKAADVEIREREERIEVDLSRRVLRHYEGDELANSFRVGVGSEQYPTGMGRFYIWVKVPYENPNNPYGIMALGLSGFSPVLSDWPGQGRMAVHGTPYASNRGQAVSHGCVRVYNDDMQALLDLPLGTPVEISR
jgi:lipoprotein-anchoring transpeptidase ErfK/SrfK